MAVVARQGEKRVRRRLDPRIELREARLLAKPALLGDGHSEIPRTFSGGTDTGPTIEKAARAKRAVAADPKRLRAWQRGRPATRRQRRSPSARRPRWWPGGRSPSNRRRGRGCGVAVRAGGRLAAFSGVAAKVARRSLTICQGGSGSARRPVRPAISVQIASARASRGSLEEAIGAADRHRQAVGEGEQPLAEAADERR